MKIDADVLTFPFRRERWQTKLAIGAAVALVAMFIWPLFLPLWGYALDVLRRAQRNGELVLPEWDDWGQHFKDGLRALVISFVYFLPFTLLYCLAVGLMFLMIPATVAAEQNPEVAIFALLAQFGGIVVFGLAMLPGLVLAYLSVVANTRMIATDSLNAGFEFREVWTLGRRGLKEFGLAFVVVFGLYTLFYVVSMALGYTLVLLCLLPFVAAAGVAYIMVVSGALFGLAYRSTGADTAARDVPSPAL